MVHSFQEGVLQQQAAEGRANEPETQTKSSPEAQPREAGKVLHVRGGGMPGQALAVNQNAARPDGAALSTAVAELERCLAINQELQAANQELQQRLTSSKAMLEQRDELIRQNNVLLRAATQAKEAAQQKANDLEMRVSANMRTIATLSTEIAESRETERLVASALLPEGDGEARLETFQRRVRDALNRRRPAGGEVPRLPVSLPGHFGVDPAPPFARGTHSPPGDAKPGGGLHMNGPPPLFLATSIKHVPPPPSMDQRAWENDALRGTRNGNALQGGEPGWWGGPRGTPHSEGLRLEAAMREWGSNGGRAGTQGDQSTVQPLEQGDPSRPHNAPPQNNLSLVDLVGSMEWLARRQQAQQGPAVWPGGGVPGGEIHSPGGDETKWGGESMGAQHAGGINFNLLNGLATGGGSNRLRLSPSHNSAFSAPASRGVNLTPIHPPITLAEILARPQNSSQGGAMQSSPSSTRLEKQPSGQSQEVSKKRSRGGRGLKAKDGEGDGDPPDCEEAVAKRGAKPRGKRECPMCGNLLAAAAADCPKCGHIFRPSKWNTRATQGLLDESPRGARLALQRPPSEGGMLPQLSLRMGPHSEGGAREEVGEHRWRPEGGGFLPCRGLEMGGAPPGWWHSGGARDESSSHGGHAAFTHLMGGVKEHASEQGGPAVGNPTPPNWALEAFATMTGVKYSGEGQGAGAFGNGGPHAPDWGRQPGGMQPETSARGMPGPERNTGGGRGKKRKAAAATQGPLQSSRTGPITHVFNWGGDLRGGRPKAHAAEESNPKDGPEVELSLASPNSGQPRGTREPHMHSEALAAASAHGLNLNGAQIAGYVNTYPNTDRNTLGWGRELDLTKK
ncbi:hypothetical protein KFL_001170050 [Klebsormidium nitens]|uniref:Uncharacterized protein n=1 Tax=Klebsormidium nitens TaxID=105231 RepID=A0A1Y1HVD7_KLENI|nr:hypothetical protein KFL_001170050 [Klebsormidium nitens]|eukprot:GAQ82600.1 hypothetical protein KFL_001170050 [Klebsormidium nitens]